VLVAGGGGCSTIVFCAMETFGAIAKGALSCSTTAAVVRFVLADSGCTTAGGSGHG